jgi:DNA-binding transcriptional LysR family regulator
MDTRTAEYFIAIYEEGSLVRAARRLGISQPALSNFLLKLEKQNGQPLFHRNNKKMQLTGIGRILLDGCRQIVETKNRTYSAIFAMEQTNQEHFTVGVTPHRGSGAFARIYPMFHKRFPLVAVDAHEGYQRDTLKGLNEGTTDLVIGILDQAEWDNYNFIIDQKEDMLLCVPSFHPVAQGQKGTGSEIETIDISLLASSPFIMWGDDTISGGIIDRFLSSAGITPTIIYKSNNAILIDSMLSGGIGVGFLPASYCKPNASRVYFRVSPQLSVYGGIICRKNTGLSKAQRYFIHLRRQDVIANNALIAFQNEKALEIYNEFAEEEHGL